MFERTDVEEDIHEVEWMAAEASEASGSPAALVGPKGTGLAFLGVSLSFLCSHVASGPWDIRYHHVPRS